MENKAYAHNFKKFKNYRNSPRKNPLWRGDKEKLLLSHKKRKKLQNPKTETIFILDIQKLESEEIERMYIQFQRITKKSSLNEPTTKSYYPCLKKEKKKKGKNLPQSRN